ncbi:phosphatase PAP2 family protein [Legionella cardiaca]|uniref:undecaprenyl-diphosphate phosphatase n=1 Tax=Legionella cardiaca TaxID=1071983 RepID=A0ABY8AU80_9GAMM|nr:phosphatase PAP2 family protein [Legionella cardiaca]WED43075.1 phosphatase PAP2 family protein [Legionella cardiaca]
MDNLASFILFFSDGIVIIPFIVFGLICLDRSMFNNAAYLVLISILINVALKVSFQIPLPASVAKNWFAFPSGHMQMAAVFYGWLACRINFLWFRILVTVILFGIGFSLIHLGYHNVCDVIGALFFALLIVTGYQRLLSKTPQNLIWILLSTAICLLVYIQLVYAKIPTHAKVAFYALLILLLAKKLVMSRRTRNKHHQ